MTQDISEIIKKIEEQKQILCDKQDCLQPKHDGCYRCDYRHCIFYQDSKTKYAVGWCVK